jgi:hypothetical protein
VEGGDGGVVGGKVEAEGVDVAEDGVAAVGGGDNCVGGVVDNLGRWKEKDEDEARQTLEETRRTSYAPSSL